MHVSVQTVAVAHAATDLLTRADEARHVARSVLPIGDGSRTEPLAAALLELADAVADVLEVSALALTQLGQRASRAAVLYDRTEQALGSRP